MLDATGSGERSALVTITDVEGSSSREPGTHLAVSETGRFLGSLSGGCVEAAVVAEAIRVISTGRHERIRLGAGSPLIDIRLPCGGAIELSIIPQPSMEVISMAYDALSARQAIGLAIDADGILALAPGEPSSRSGWNGDAFVARHVPDPRLVILGHGAEVKALAMLGRAHGLEVSVLSPDIEIVATARSSGIEAFHLKTPARSHDLLTDRHTAVVFLFHDHDWESELLRQALDQETFYVGAMGSRHTHALRVSALLDRGASPRDVARLVGPIGLIPAARDPQTLALSVLAQVIEDARSPEGALLAMADTDDVTDTRPVDTNFEQASLSAIPVPRPAGILSTHLS